jgi:hypothetical protein
MAKIILAYRRKTDEAGEISTYDTSVFEALLNRGHDVMRVGENQVGYQSVADIPITEFKSYDLFLDLDCGRNKHGDQHFQYQSGQRAPIPSAVRLIDTHGHPSLHKRMAGNYDHVFFAVWARRDAFASHTSAHWAPCASDDKWFDFDHHAHIWRYPKVDIGFYGSKDGLDRADEMRDICLNAPSNFSYDIREVGRTDKRRWPRTAEQMANCKILFNRGQKHDGPNQRVIESMLLCKPLITDRDKTDGMSKLFQEGEHYLGYDSRAQIFDQMRWCKSNEDLARSMAFRAYRLVKEKHLVRHRVDQILEVCL